ncbi:MAG: PTS mannitol transporter subunit IICB [Anaerostipes sp.]|jgi:PTS system mannitol-specific IIC component|nr:PTS mannitol transporter subunit IICB [Anaerostipes sp.]MDD3745577.1 PTS mannitol transporter subunit IICB [Anaerostipes sp.]
MEKKSFRARMQAFGGFLTAMVIPNMGAFIAWGFITALFIDTGWMPNKNFSQLVGPMSTYMLPLLIAFMGGKLVHGDRGGVAGAIGTIGLIIGAEIPMFLGAMVMGPLSAWVIKKFDGFIDDKVPTGFEMIISNFSLGIIGLLLCLCSYSFIGPAILQANHFLTVVIQAIVKTGALPLVAVLNEPAKVLFLNNVIDQGIYYPLGMQQALSAGKSVYFMLASNPGAGLGLLLAYSFFGKGQAKRTAPGAIIIHFLGGIHEIYFPYVLMKPITILGMIAGSASGIVTFSLFNAGLVAGPSPGSIFSYLALTPKGNFVGVIAGVLVATGVSFLVNSFLLKTSKATDDEQLEEAMESSKAMKQEGKDILEGAEKTAIKEVKSVVFACDAGLGSSAMGASNFRKRIQKEGLDITVENYAIEKVPADTDIMVVHENLFDRAKTAKPGIQIVTIKNFLKDPNIEELFEELVKNQK